MPFQTDMGPAVLVENICKVEDIAERLGVHVNSIYQWVRNRERNGFPEPLNCGNYHFDYADVYDWFKDWVKSHPGNYGPVLVAILSHEE